MKAVGGKRVPAGVAAQQRQGDADGVSENRVWQIKHTAQTPPALLIHAWEQAFLASRGTGKRALVGVTLKPGPGKKAMHFVLESRDQWLAYEGRDE